MERGTLTFARRSPMEECIERLYREQIHCDAEIRCEGRLFPVHLNIVCTRSAYFQKAFDGHFKEAKTKVLDLEEDTAETIERCLDFLYLEKYSACLVSDPLVHAKLHAAADKYQIPGMCDWARGYFAKALDDGKELPASLLEIIAQVYANAHSGADGLRVAIVEYMRKHIKTVLALEDFSYLVQSTNGLGVDLIQALISQPASKSCSCSGIFATCATCLKKEGKPVFAFGPEKNFSQQNTSGASGQAS